MDGKLSDILNYVKNELLTIEITKVSLTYIYNYADVANIYLDFRFKEKTIGTYEIVFTLTGDIIDNFLEIDNVDYFAKSVAIEDRNIEVAKIALYESAKIEFVAKITGLSIMQLESLQNSILLYSADKKPSSTEYKVIFIRPRTPTSYFIYFSKTALLLN